MFERFTESARQVVVLAHEEARLMRHERVGTEHLLVGLARVDDDVASAVLRAHGLTGENARAAVVRLAGVGDAGEEGHFPFTPAARDALDATLREALGLGHDKVQPAHLLLGILRQRDALARRVLSSAGANPTELRAEIVRRLGESPAPAPPDASPVKIGDVPLGDLGNPRADGRLLLEILERHGAVAAWLRERGIDEDAVRGMLGES
jgi:ATP-dependent Clp protease ATP-binding subunit ClpC